MKKSFVTALFLAASFNAYAVDGGAVIGGALGGAAGAAVGHSVGGQNGAIIGAAIGGGAGAAIGSSPAPQAAQPAPVHAVAPAAQRSYDDDDERHHDHGKKLGHKKHKHGHEH